MPGTKLGNLSRLNNIVPQTQVCYDSRMSLAKKVFGLLISVFFLWLALRNVEWHKIPDILRDVRRDYLLLMMVPLVCEGLSRTYRWQVILLERRLPFGLLYSGLILGYFFNNIFPARAGEFARALYISRRRPIRTSEIFGSIILERFLDGVVVMVFLAITLSLFQVSALIRAGGFSALVFYTLVFLFMVLFQFRRDWVETLLNYVLRPFPESWRIRLLSVQQALAQGFSLLRQPRQLLNAIVLSFFAWGISLTTVWLCLKAMNLSYGPGEVILLMTILSLGAMIPSSPGMIGLFEYCCVLALSEMLGATREVAVTFGILLHVISYVFMMILGGVVLFRENLAIRELEEKPPLSAPTPP